MKNKIRITERIICFALLVTAISFFSYRVYWTRIVKPVPEEMVLIPGGWTVQGCQGASPGLCLENEKPSVKVFVESFYMDTHEVTVGEYWKCVKTGQCKSPIKKRTHKLHNSAFNNNKLSKQNHPMNGITWYEANRYCSSKGKSLPTEAQFEHALRGGLTDQTFPWGETIPASPDYGNYLDFSAKKKSEEFHFNDKKNATVNDKYVYTAPVCSFRKNLYGLCDISGNVTEWCRDFYGPDWYTRLKENINPVNLTESEHMVTRGCDWHHETGRSIRSSKRGYYPPHFSTFYIGFRCVKNAEDSGLSDKNAQ